MDKFKQYFFVDCVSFTILTVLYTALSLLGVTPAPDAQIVFILLAMTTCIAVLLSITDRFFSGFSPMRMVVELAEVFGVVFLIGGLTGFIPIWEEPIYILIVAAMILAIYFGTWFMMLLKTQADANEINRKIRKLHHKEEG